MSGEECTLSQITDERNTGTTISHKRSVIGYQSPKSKETVNVWTLIPLSGYCHLVKHSSTFISICHLFKLNVCKNLDFLKFKINKLIKSKKKLFGSTSPW